MTDHINALAADIRLIDGNHDLGTGELAEKLIELGWTKLPVRYEDHPAVPAPVLTPRALKDYKQGEAVQVMSPRAGDWISGVVSYIEQRGALLHVDTERGPISVASFRRIRPVNQ